MSQPGLGPAEPEGAGDHRPDPSGTDGARGQPDGAARPLVTLILPAYNEAAVLARNLDTIMAYLATLAVQYRFEVLVVNDGSRDATGAVAEDAALRHPDLRVLHHRTNYGLGRAFKTGFAASRGDYVVTMDADLSYGPDTVGRLLDAITRGRARIVLASAYMPGGRTTRVPFMRHLLSRIGNWLLARMNRGQLSTFTCMVRAYDGPFIRSMEPRADGMGIMPEIIYKTLILGGRIEEIPAHLDWSLQRDDQAAAEAAGAAPKRVSSMRIASHVLSTSISSFLFRPFMMMFVPGLLMLAFSLYVNAWLMVDLAGAIPRVGGDLSDAAGLVFQERPATLLIGLLTLLLAIQLLSLGALSLQTKKYYEETYYQLVRLREQIGLTSGDGAERRDGDRDAGPGP